MPRLRLALGAWCWGGGQRPPEAPSHPDSGGGGGISLFKQPQPLRFPAATELPIQMTEWRVTDDPAPLLGGSLLGMCVQVAQYPARSLGIIIYADTDL